MPAPFISGVILAAGKSTRMGRSKALLPAADGRTFLSTLAGALAEGGVSEILVVHRLGDEPLLGALASMSRPAGPPVRAVPNPAADDGQLSSLLAATRAVAPESAGMLVVPVDMPRITASAVQAVVSAFAREEPPVARAVFQGRHGHPVLFARSAFAALERADPAVGARDVVRRLGALDVETWEPGVLTDVDTPEDYRRVVGDGRQAAGGLPPALTDT